MLNINCNSCHSCYSCYSCDSCDSCYSCYSCVNLKMTEYNYFCWSEKRNDENSFQQKRYRVFNTQLTKEEYKNIASVYIKIEFDQNESYVTRYKTAFKKAWEKLSQEEKDKITSLPGFDPVVFKKYWGVEVDQEMEVHEEVIELNGKKYKLID